MARLVVLQQSQPSLHSPWVSPSSSLLPSSLSEFNGTGFNVSFQVSQVTQFSVFTFYFSLIGYNGRKACLWLWSRFNRIGEMFASQREHFRYRHQVPRRFSSWVERDSLACSWADSLWKKATRFVNFWCNCQNLKAMIINKSSFWIFYRFGRNITWVHMIGR